MSSLKQTKINQLLQIVPSGVVLSTGWLSDLGYYPELIRNYRKSNWLESIGNGAVKRTNDQLDYLGGIYCLQEQMGLTVHPSGKTALNLLGRGHYLPMNEHLIYLSAVHGELLPRWFQKYDWEVELCLFTSNFLPSRMGMTEVEHKNFRVQVSNPARAMLECLYLAPEKISIEECFHLMEGLVDLVPRQVQELLENCNSVKVKRLFLYLSGKANHGWLKYIDTSKLDLGQGKRSFTKNGTYVSEYQITVPKQLELNEFPEI